MQNQSECEITFETQLNPALSMICGTCIDLQTLVKVDPTLRITC